MIRTAFPSIFGARLRRIAGLVGVVAAVAFAVLPAVRAAEGEGESMAERKLKSIAERQRQVFTDAERQGDKANLGNVQQQLQQLSHEYELLLRENPKFTAGYVAYGMLLRKVDMRREAKGMFMKADQLDPNIPLVKNQLGNFMAEEGKPREAAALFLMAIKLEPREPLYHYQLGTLLAEGRDTFLKSGEWTRATLDAAMMEAFNHATELAPDRFEFAYRQAEAYYDLEKPDWDAALKAWTALEEKAETAIERQTMRLHAANILIKQGRVEHARLLLATVDEKNLQSQKQKLLDQIAPMEKK